MEFLIELLIELIIEGSIEISENEKVSKWIRYPLIVLIILVFTVIIFGILIIGIYYMKEKIYVALLLISISFILLISAINRRK